MKLILAYTLTLATIVTAEQQRSGSYSSTQDNAAPTRRTIQKKGNNNNNNKRQRQRTLQDDVATRPPLATRPPIPVPGVTRPPIDTSTPPDGNGETIIPTFSPTVMPSPTPTIGKVATAFPTKAIVVEEETSAPTVGSKDTPPSTDDSSPTSMPSFRPTALTDPNYGWNEPTLALGGSDGGGAYCVLIQTLTDPDASGATTPEGYVTVEIDSGSGYIVETTPYDEEEGGQEYAQGEVVLDKCYQDILGVTVFGPDGNGWRGSIMYSTDNKVTYTPFVCVENCSGDEDETDPIAVDNNGNGGSENGPNCLNGDVCTLKMTRDDDDGGVDSETGTTDEVVEECQSIVDIASGNPDFSTLVAAVTAAGLVDALSGDGPLTVFAPTNDAFAALPEGAVESLLQAENIDALTDILTYHVVAAKVLSTDPVNGEDVETLNGDSITVTLDDDGSVKINDSNVITADIEACEGVIHVIDAVLIPPADDDDSSVAVETSSPTAGATSGSPTSEPTLGATPTVGGNVTLAPTSSSTGLSEGGSVTTSSPTPALDTSDDGTDSPTPALVPATETSSPTAASEDDDEEVSAPTVVSMIPITSSPTNTVSMLNPPSASLPDGMTDSPTEFVNVTNPIFGYGSKSYKSKGSKASSTLEEEDASRPSGKSGKGSKSVEGKASKSTKGSKAGYLNSLYRAEDISAAPDRKCRWSIVALGALYLWFA